MAARPKEMDSKCFVSAGFTLINGYILIFQDFGNITGLQVTAPTPQMSGGQSGGFQAGTGFRGGPRT